MEKECLALKGEQAAADAEEGAGLSAFLPNAAETSKAASLLYVTKCADDQEGNRAMADEQRLATFVKTLGEEGAAILLEHTREAEKQVRRFVRLVPDSPRQADLERELQETLVGQLQPQQRLLVWFDQKCAGEAITAPHLRMPPFRQEKRGLNGDRNSNLLNAHFIFQASMVHDVDCQSLRRK